MRSPRPENDSRPLFGCEAALAVFVKTPGLSPIKTRLAEQLGCERAEEFYRLSLAAVEAAVAVAAKATGFCPFWAVAEQSGLANPRWQRFSRLPQGTGGLGERLGHVFDTLQRRYQIVVAIGADAPQITPEILAEAVRHLQYDPTNRAHTLGRCHDGGFYLVGTNYPLSPETWRNVPYSTSAAAEHLAANLNKQGTVCELARLSDVDRGDDLAVLRDELIALSHPSPEQLAVLDWIVATPGAIRDASPR